MTIATMNFFDSQLWTVRILDIFGFFSFNVRTSNTNIRKFFYSTCVSFCEVLVILVTFYCFSATSTDFVNDHSKVTRTVNDVELSTMFFCFLLWIYVILFKTNDQKELFRNFQKLELEVEKLGFFEDTIERINLKLGYYNKLWISISAVLYFIEMLIYVFILTVDNPFSHKMVNSMDLSIEFYFTSLTLLLTCQILAVANFIKIINENLKFFVSHSAFYETEISKLLKMIHEIQYLISLWSKCFGLIVFGLFVFIFGVFSSELYLALAIFQFSSEIATGRYLLYTALNVTWNVPLFIQLSILGLSCSKVHNEINKSVKILCKASLECGEIAKGSIQMFLIYFDSSDYHFTANDFFIINGSICYNVGRLWCN